MIEAIQHHLVRLAAGFDERLVLGLARLNPQANTAREIFQPHVGLVGVGQSRAKAQRAIAIAHSLQLVRLQCQCTQPNHHTFVGFAGVARQCQRMVGVVAVVNVCNLQVGLEDGGFDGHAFSSAR